MVTPVSPLSIIIESKSSSTGSWDSDTMHPSPLASHPFRIPTPSFTDLDIPSELQYSSRPMSVLSVAGTRTSYLGGDLHDTVCYSENVRRRRSRDDVAALIEFLRTHEPPPDNFMSQPYRTEEEERGKWDKLRVMGKRRSKSMSRVPAPIRLPDSAVAGITTGGHRHIAISIPLDASHFGEDPKSQYPVINHTVQSPAPPPPESIRTFKNKNGVVTVLRPISSSHHYSNLPPSPASPGRFDRDFPPQLLRNRRMMPPSPPPSSPADSEHWPLAQLEAAASSHAQQATVSHEGSDETRSKIALSQSSEFVRAAYPTRCSSMVPPKRGKHHHTSSIDEVIAEEESYNRNPSPMPRDCAVRRTERHVGHPPVSLNTSPVSRKSTSSPRPERPADKETAARPPRVTQITDTPVIARVASPSPPASITSTKSRREKVRDKKLRDIAAARSAKLSRMPSPTATETADPSVASPAKSQSAPTADGQSGPKLSTIMVVVDMQPDEEAASKEPAATASDATEAAAEVRPESAATLPTPPTSTDTSPAQKHGFDAHTSLTRPRDQDRKQREAGGVAVTDPEREILHLYEAYREQRLRDMESRVRRLERNGDLWVRALLPMLEDVRSGGRLGMAAAGSHPQRSHESLRDWASDDEAAAATTNSAGAATGIDRLACASQRRRLIRRASLSRERMLEELMRREERDLLDRGGSHHQPDVSGMGSIEPLMRELAAGGARPEPPTTSRRRSSSTPKPRPRPAPARRVSGGDVPPIPLRPPPVHNRMWV